VGTTWRHGARLLVRRLGLDFTRFPESTPGWRAAQLFAHHGVQTVLDVGANSGGYASGLRTGGYTGRIISFEPVAKPFNRLEALAQADPGWSAHRCALGPEQAEVTIHVAGNAAASSSMLPMLERHAAAAPSSRYVATEQVAQHRLDDLWPDLGGEAHATFLKLDVQGYERHVLNGAPDLLATCRGLQIETCLVPLYADGISFEEGLALAAAHGFQVEGVEPGFTDPRTGQLLQADLLMFRAS
jgi:FkbM family methyltransferase